MNEEEKWEALMHSIRKAAHILNIDITEKDVPAYLNWPVARDMNEKLWARVYRTRLQMVCAWCGKEMGYKPGKGTTGISHGICKGCAKDTIGGMIKKVGNQGG